MKTVIVYGSTMGNTSDAAERIQQFLGGAIMSVSDMDARTLQDADLLVLGSSTWGIGELQDDWDAGIEAINSADLSGRKVALFGLGDQAGYADSFVDALGLLYNAVKSRGADVVGFTSTDGYDYLHSEAEVDGKFVGLALDEDNQSEMTAERIKEWVQAVKAEVGIKNLKPES